MWGAESCIASLHAAACVNPAFSAIFRVLLGYCHCHAVVVVVSVVLNLQDRSGVALDMANLIFNELGSTLSKGGTRTLDKLLSGVIVRNS